MRHFIDLADFSREQVRALLALAAALEREPQPTALAGKVLGLLFMNPSLRTLASCQAAMARLGGSSLVISPGGSSWQLESRSGVVMDGAAAEHIREGLPVLASYCDALGIRQFAEGKDLDADLRDARFGAMAALLDKPLINLESAATHPCQALADWKTLDELGIAPHGKLVLAWAYHPRALPLAVPAAVLHMAAMRGMQVTVLRPEAFALPSAIMHKARRAAALSGGSVSESANRGEALADADVLYVKEWASTAAYGHAAADAAARQSHRDWCVSEAWFDGARPDCRLMHCLPVRRNVAIGEQLLDGPRSIVLRQAFNRLPVQMAVLYQLLKRPSEATT
jgi:N-acetylornithine carbamoyltransferase